MKIPNEVPMFGQEIKVVWDKTLVDDTHNYGMANFNNNTIRIQPNTSSIVRKDSEIEYSFIHEVIHHMFHQLSYDKLRDDEELVERLSRLLQQVLGAIYK